MDNRWIIAAVVPAIFLTGCEKAGEYKESPERTANMIVRDSINENTTYLYVPSTGAAPRYAINQNPFFQGEEKLVQLRFTSSGLEVLELDHDADLDADGKVKPGRYVSAGEDYKLYPVLTIPGEYIDFRCLEDQFGECTNVEEAKPDEYYTRQGIDADDIWQHKPYFKPDYKELTVNEKNLTDLWFRDSRLTETNVTVKSTELDDGVLNIKLQRTFSVGDDALWDFYNGSLSDLSFKTDFYYSLVDINQLASDDYERVFYADTEHDTYGFFKSEINKRGITGSGAVDVSRRYLLHRFNPKKASVQYHLSDTFNKPENKIFKDATYQVIARINEQLEQAGVPIVELVEPSGKHSGDLRYNMINLLDDPLDNGLLGYGPSVAHPLTGEIVKAHVNQYSGVARKLSRRVWNSTVRLYNRGDLAVHKEEQEGPTPDSKAHTIQAHAHHQYGMHVGEIFDEKKSLSDLVEKQAEYDAHIDTVKAKAPYLSEQTVKAVSKNLMELPAVQQQRFYAEDEELLALAQETQERIDYWSEHNALGEESIWISATEKGFIEGLEPKDYAKESGDLKVWDELTLPEQQAVSDAIAVFVYKTTLVHEFGHNLGLRHNFNGSNDKDNFYTQQEAQEQGLTLRPAYSSVMDYGPSQLDELKIYGKYDVAALNFGYNRQIEVKDSEKEHVGYIDLTPYDAQNRAAYNNKDADFNQQAKYGIVNYLDNLSDEYADVDAKAEALKEKELALGEPAVNWSATYAAEYGALTTAQATYEAVIASEESTESEVAEAQAALDANLQAQAELRAQASDEYLAYSASIEDLAAHQQALVEKQSDDSLTQEQKDAAALELAVVNAELELIAAKDELAAAREKAAAYELSTAETRALLEKGKMAEYQYCTDGHVSLNTTCNRFDEGTDIYEITQYRIQNYFDSYFSRNLRDGRTDFWESDILSYTIRRMREFAEIRDVIEDYERFDVIFSDMLGQENVLAPLSDQCEAKGNDPFDWGQTWWGCDYAVSRVKAARLAGNFFIDVILEPDHACELKDTEGDHKFMSLAEIFDDAKWRLPEGYPVPTSCFDPQVAEYLETNPIWDDEKSASFTHTVISESGRYLNGFNNNDPSHKYSNERAVLGTWLDKLLAMRNLVSRETSRSTTDENFYALVDISGVNERFVDALSANVLGKESDLVTFRDKDGQAVETATPYKLDGTALMNPVPFYYEGMYRRFFKLNKRGQTATSRALLAQISHVGWSDDERVERKARAITEMVSVRHYESNRAPLDPISYVYQDDTYEATTENKLAYEIISAALNAEKYSLADAQAAFAARFTAYSDGDDTTVSDLERIDELLLIAAKNGLSNRYQEVSDILAQEGATGFDVALGFYSHELIDIDQAYEIWDLIDSADQAQLAQFILEGVEAETPPQEATESQLALYTMGYNALIELSSPEHRAKIATELLPKLKLLPGSSE